MRPLAILTFLLLGAAPAAARMADTRYVLIPASPDTRGHGTHSWARFWRNELVDLLARTDP